MKLWQTCLLLCVFGFVAPALLRSCLAHAGTPDWAKPPPPCCQRTTCYESPYRPDGGFRVVMCDGDHLCHGCTDPCLKRYVGRDGGTECEDDATPLPDGGYEPLPWCGSGGQDDAGHWYIWRSRCRRRSYGAVNSTTWPQDETP